MKRMLCVLLAMLICLSLAACGGDTPTTGATGNEKPDPTTTPTEGNKPVQSGSYQPDPELPGTIRINLPNVQYCVDAPGTLDKRSGTGKIIELSSYFVIYDQFVAGTSDEKYEVVLEDIHDADDILEALSKQFANCAEDGLIRATDYTCVIESKENVSINGWEMCKYKGKIQLTHKYELDYDEANFVAYGLIKDGYPVYFAVVEKPDGDKPIDIEEMADKIAKTFREYTED